MAQPQLSSGLVQHIVQLGLLLVGQAGVDDAGDGHIPAARHLPHSGDPVLSVHHIEIAVPEADHNGGQQARVPLGDQLVHILRLHRPLIGQAGGQLGGGEITAHAGVMVLYFGDGGLLLQGFLFGGTALFPIAHLFIFLSIKFNKSSMAEEMVAKR